MAACRITLTTGETVDVRSDFEPLLEELHKVSTRREHSFAVLEAVDGEPVAMRPDAVVHVRPLARGDDAAPAR